ncbi:conserved hypothetical protein [Ricinus communis]|uniref:Uncharacterized protein n=1 Tax=Ricinus communis TaxID=3988 RepID=B9TLY3_RICCO|nr:conserved hypothetical protein [Ricinus communis]
MSSASTGMEAERPSVAIVRPSFESEAASRNRRGSTAFPSRPVCIARMLQLAQVASLTRDLIRAISLQRRASSNHPRYA